jgi:hypothetical protein
VIRWSRPESGSVNQSIILHSRKIRVRSLINRSLICGQLGRKCYGHRKGQMPINSDYEKRFSEFEIKRCQKEAEKFLVKRRLTAHMRNQLYFEEFLLVVSEAARVLVR